MNSSIAVLPEVKNYITLPQPPGSEGTLVQFVTLPDEITALLEETAIPAIGLFYSFSDQLLEQGKITEPGLREIISTTREADPEHRALVASAIAQASYENITSRDEAYQRLYEAQREMIGCPSNTERGKLLVPSKESQAYWSLWGINGGPIIDPDLKLFQEAVLEIINDDPNRPMIEGMQFDQTNDEPSIEDILTIVANLAIENRVNAQTLLNVIEYTERVIGDITSRKAELLDQWALGK